MGVVVPTTGTQTATLTTEHTLLDTSTNGRYVLIVDTSVLTATEIVTFRQYNKVLSGDSYAVDEELAVQAGQYPVLVTIGPVEAPYGCKFTLTQVNGTGRAFKWRIVNLAANLGQIEGTAVAGTLSKVQATINPVQTVANSLRGRTLFWVTGSANPGFAQPITDNDASSPSLLTFANSAPATIVAADPFIIS